MRMMGSLKSTAMQRLLRSSDRLAFRSRRMGCKKSTFAAFIPECRYLTTAEDAKSCTGQTASSPGEPGNVTAVSLNKGGSDDRCLQINCHCLGSCCHQRHFEHGQTGSLRMPRRSSRDLRNSSVSRTIFIPGFGTWSINALPEPPVTQERPHNKSHRATSTKIRPGSQAIG